MKICTLLLLTSTICQLSHAQTGIVPVAIVATIRGRAVSAGRCGARARTATTNAATAPASPAARSAIPRFHTRGRSGRAARPTRPRAPSLAAASTRSPRSPEMKSSLTARPPCASAAP